MAEVVGDGGAWGTWVQKFRDMQAEIERLRAAGDALADALRYWIDGNEDVFADDAQSVRAWKEARRG